MEKKKKKVPLKETEVEVCTQAADLQTPPVASGWSGMRLQSGPLGLPEVSQTCTLPHLVGCLPQMVGLGGSRVEDVALIPPCLRWELRHGSLRTASAKQERQRNINSGFSPSDATMFCVDCRCILRHSPVWLPPLNVSLSQLLKSSEHDMTRMLWG